jgi:hypothetical protein
MITLGVRLVLIKYFAKLSNRALVAKRAMEEAQFE